MRLMERTVHLLGLLVLTSAIAIGQTVTSGLRGTVSDASGAVVPQAEVTVTNEHTGLTNTTTTDAAGRYSCLLLPIGTYKLTATKAGFKTYQRTGIVLNASVVVGLNIQLEIGAVAQQVEVTSATPLVNTQTSNTGTLVDRQQIVQLPLNGRNVAQLAQLTNGVTYMRVSPTYNTNLNIPGTAMSVNGNLITMVQYNLDGANVGEARFNALVNYPNPDAVNQFQFLTSDYTAEYGRSAGGIMNVVTQSGTNSIHGSVWEFNRNSSLAARSFFLPTVSPLNQNQFGFGVGGPAIKNKLFWFGSYQGLRISQGQDYSSGFPPTAAMRNGDFSAVSTPIINPLTNTPFPGNQIPVSSFDPVAAKFLDLWPLPNTPDGRRIGSAPVQTHENQLLLRSDYVISDTHRLSFTYFRESSDVRNTLAGSFPYAGDLSNWALELPANQNIFIGHFTSTLRPNLLNDFMFSYTKQDLGYDSTSPNVTLATLGSNIPTYPYPGGIGINSPEGIAGQQVGPYFSEATAVYWWTKPWQYEAKDTITLLKGPHSLKFGIDYMYFNLYHYSSNGAAGVIATDGTNTGDPLADFLLGKTQFYYNTPANFSATQGNWSGFVQDDFKATHNLTLNMGLRYQISPMWKMPPSWPLQGGGEAPEAVDFIPGQQSKVFVNAPTGFVFPGDSGVPDTMAYTDKNDWGPRFGLAWDVFGDGKTSVRAGWGLFYVTTNGQITDELGSNPPFTLAGEVPETTSLVDPLPANVLQAYPLQDHLAHDMSWANYLPASWRGVDTHMIDPSFQEWNLSIQRQLPHNMAVQAAYVGNTGRHLYMDWDLNSPRYIPGTDANGNPLSTNANANSRRPYNQGLASPVYGYVRTISNGNNSAYHSLQLQMQKRFSQGVTFFAAYTWSKAIDQCYQGGTQGWFGCRAQDNVTPNFLAEKGDSNFDQPHRFTASFDYNTPSLTHLMGSSNRMAKYFLDDWQVTGLVSIASGFPFTVGSPDHSLQNGGFASARADLIGDPSLPSGRPLSAQLHEWFNTAAFAPEQIGQFGTAGRNILRGPGQSDVDLGIFKNVPIAERVALQLRLELFNAFNQPTFGNPSSTVTSGSFGRITSAGPGRIIQIGAKVTF